MNWTCLCIILHLRLPVRNSPFQSNVQNRKSKFCFLNDDIDGAWWLPDLFNLFNGNQSILYYLQTTMNVKVQSCLSSVI